MALVQRIPLGVLAVGFTLNYDNIIKVFCVLVCTLQRGGRWVPVRKCRRASSLNGPRLSAAGGHSSRLAGWQAGSLRVDDAEGFSKRFSASMSPPIFPFTCRATRTHTPSAHRIIVHATRARLPYRQRRHYLRT